MFGGKPKTNAGSSRQDDDKKKSKGLPSPGTVGSTSKTNGDHDSKNKSNLAPKGKDRDVTDRQKNSQTSSARAMPQTQIVSGTTQALGKLSLQGSTGVPAGGGSSSGNKDDKRRCDDKKPDKGKRGTGPPGGGGDPGNDPPSGGSRTIKNLESTACILSHSGFPTELRDEIFSYMLDHRVVEYDPNDPPPESQRARMSHSHFYFDDCGRAPAYDFSFELFMHCNKQTRSEAIKYFNGVNQLILVSFDMPEFRKLLHYHCVPVVSDRASVDYSNIAAVHLSFNWPISAVNQTVDGALTHRHEVEDHDKLLLLLKDFPKLCSLLKFACQYFLPPAVYIVSGRDQPSSFVPLKNDNAPVLTLNIVKPDILSDVHRKGLADDLRQIVGGGHGLTITSNDDHDPIATPEFVHSLKAIMAPPLIWLHALEFDRLNTAKAVRADAFPLTSRYVDGLYKRYRKFWRHFIEKRALLLEHWLQNSAVRENSEFTAIRRASLPLDVYVQFELGFMSWHAEETAEAINPGCAAHVVKEILDRLNGYEGHADWPAPMKLLLHHLQLAAMLQEDGKKTITEASESLRALTLTMHAIPDHYPAVEHDLGLLTPLLDETDPDRDNPILEDIFLNLASFHGEDCCEHGSCWGFELLDMGPEEPIDGLKDWQDEIALSRLTKAEKRAILKMQSDNGLRLSEF